VAAVGRGLRAACQSCGVTGWHRRDVMRGQHFEVAP
jgi:hypothetical protein